MRSIAQREAALAVYINEAAALEAFTQDHVTRAAEQCLAAGLGATQGDVALAIETQVPAERGQRVGRQQPGGGRRGEAQTLPGTEAADGKRFLGSQPDALASTAGEHAGSRGLLLDLQRTAGTTDGVAGIELDIATADGDTTTLLQQATSTGI